jgi:hypothetical protein
LQSGGLLYKGLTGAWPGRQPTEDGKQELGKEKEKKKKKMGK